MGTSITPTYRVEVTETTVSREGVRTQTTPLCWEGKVSDAALERWVKGYAKSLEHGGVNAHVSEALGYIPYPNKARIVHHKSGEVRATWKAAMFQVW